MILAETIQDRTTQKKLKKSLAAVCEEKISRNSPSDKNQMVAPLATTWQDTPPSNNTELAEKTGPTPR